jgi:hypothetical protein
MNKKMIAKKISSFPIKSQQPKRSLLESELKETDPIIV